MINKVLNSQKKNKFVDSREETQHYKHVKIVSLYLEGENKIYATSKIVKIKPD
jgi:hypothetical protein